MNRTKAVKVWGMCAVMGAVVAGSAFAQDEGPSAEAAAGVDVASAYVFRGATVSDEVSVQPLLEGSFGNLTLGTWGNLNTDTEQFDEIDYYVSYALPLGDCPVGLSVGYTEYTYPTGTTTNDEGVITGGAEADREVNVAASFEQALSDALTLSSGLSVNIGLEGPFLDEGLYVAGELGLEQSVSDDMSVSLGAVLGAELGDNVDENGLSHVTLSAGVSYMMLAATVSYVIETDDKVLEVDEDVYGAVSLSLPL